MKLNGKKTQEIIAQFKQQIENVPNVCFAYIGGSVARKEASTTSDIDFFVCIEGEISKQDVELFKEWYFSIHAEFHLSPDKEYPGEIMSISVLDSALERSASSKLRRTVRKGVLFDGVVWSGMLSGAKVGFVGNINKYEKRRKISKLILHKWRDSIKVTDDLYLKHFIKILK
ncbi:nucleotidyltransferase domain-containing protein [Candidatus Gracilibacteria bacterium]|nr:nucleotidyltransferase domain-containing protein [Candidatus Gracilibacteria bacterium]